MTLDDTATEQEEKFRELALLEHQLHAARYRIQPRGECVICGETDLPQSDALFCCPECRDDYDRRQAAKRIAGLR